MRLLANPSDDRSIPGPFFAELDKKEKEKEKKKSSTS
jgi:hypothetical protein